MKYEYQSVVVGDSREDWDLLNELSEAGWRATEVLNRYELRDGERCAKLLLERLVPISYPAPTCITPRIGEQGPWREAKISHPYALALTQEEYDLILARRKESPNV